MLIFFKWVEVVTQNSSFSYFWTGLKFDSWHRMLSSRKTRSCEQLWDGQWFLSLDAGTRTIHPLYLQYLGDSVTFPCVPKCLSDRKSWLTRTPESSWGCWKRLQLRRNASLSMWLNRSLTQLGEWILSVKCPHSTPRGRTLIQFILFLFILSVFRRQMAEALRKLNVPVTVVLDAAVG